MTRRRAGAFAIVATVVTLVTATTALASNDPDFDAFQYGPQQIYAPEAWTVSRGAGVTIAIVDSGVQTDHPDLRDKMVPGYDFLEDDPEPQDDNGHGTHVAGIAAASTDNGIGIAGTAPDAKIMPIRVLAGEATSPRAVLAIQEGIRFAVDNGAKVINLSIGEEFQLGPEAVQGLEASCLDAYNAGALCVAAAGNSGRGKPSGYSEDFNAILVAANDREGELADFSQRADTKWSVTAPGVGIHSTVIGSGYGIKQGTSMSAPHVSGVAALLFAQGLGIDEVIAQILNTATPLNDGGGSSGAGLVNAAAAVGAAYTPVTTAPRPSTTTTAAVATSDTRPSGGSTATTAVDPDFETPVELTEGLIEDDADFVGSDDGGSLLTAGGAIGEEPEAIRLSRGYESSFLVGVAVFLGVLAVLGFAARRLVIRRGIGQIKA